MHYAIIKTGGKQYQVTVGQTLQVELLSAEPGPIVFDQVLLHVDGESVEVGTPTLANFAVHATVLGETKADKIQVFKYKNKSRYRKLRGHRQRYSMVKIESLGTTPAASKPARSVKKAPVKKTATKKAAK